MKSWLVIGTLENWETSFAQPIPLWGLKVVHKNAFVDLSVGDILFFYVKNPVKGIIGFGTVKDKYIDHKTLIWREEKDTRQVIWPLRFRIGIIQLLPRQGWTSKFYEARPISILDFGLILQRGFLQLSSDHQEEIFRRIKKGWEDEWSAGLVMREEVPRYGITPEQEILKEKPTNLHKQLQLEIIEIGKLQDYYAEAEFSLPLEDQHKRIDVVWKRELTGSPTFAFEVELSGATERAITKLRLAFNQWNSQTRLIVPASEYRSVRNLVDRENVSFKNSFRNYDPEIIEKLLSKKRDLRTFEQEYGIY